MTSDGQHQDPFGQPAFRPPTPPALGARPPGAPGWEPTAGSAPGPDPQDAVERGEPDAIRPGGGARGGRSRLADRAVGVGTVLYLVGALLPWFSVDPVDAGGGASTPGLSISGFDLRLVTLAFPLLLAAAVWTALPAVVDVPLPFPRSAVTAGLAALAFLFTLIEWLRATDLGLSPVGLLTVLAAAAVVAAAALRLLCELRTTGLPGGGATAPRQADRQAPQPGPAGRPVHRPPSGGFAPPPSYGDDLQPPAPPAPEGTGAPGPVGGRSGETQQPPSPSGSAPPPSNGSLTW